MTAIGKTNLRNVSIFYKISVLLYVLSLVAPINGKFFGGAALAMYSGGFSIVIIMQLAEGWEPDLVSLMMIPLPFFNLVYFWAIFTRRGTSKVHSIGNVLLYVSVVWSALYFFVHLDSEGWYSINVMMLPFLLWLFSLFFIAIWKYRGISNV